MKKKYVSNRDESARMFKSDFLEAFSKVHYSVPLIIFLPVIGYFIYLSTMNRNTGFEILISLYLGGMIFWTFTEYFIHRYLFHFDAKSEFSKKMVFYCHGVHHDFPNDSKRLVLPPIASIPLAILFFYIFKLVLPTGFLYPFFAGFVSGYLIYDMIHYATHHAKIGGKLWMAIKTHHLKHHFKDPEKGFGVSSPIWDILFGTNYSTSEKK